MTFHELESGGRNIEISPQRHSASGRDDGKHQLDNATIPQPSRCSPGGGGRPNAHCDCAEQWDQNNRGD